MSPLEVPLGFWELLEWTEPSDRRRLGERSGTSCVVTKKSKRVWLFVFYARDTVYAPVNVGSKWVWQIHAQFWTM